MTARTTLAVLTVVTAFSTVVLAGCGTTANGDHGSDAGSGSSGASGSSSGSGSGQTSGGATGAMSGSNSGTTSGTSMSGSTGSPNGRSSGAASGVSTGAASGDRSGTSGGSSGSGSSDAGTVGAASCDAGLSVTPAPLGAPCVSENEYSPFFPQFSEGTVSVESNAGGCESLVCLINHFQGRVTCPYGQDSSSNGPDGSPGCLTPGSCDPVRPNIPGYGQTVTPQCSDRPAADAVYCSCRCANVNGGVDDAGTYCACPSDMICTQLVEAFGGGSDAIAGAYCIKAGTVWDAGAYCSKCDPTTAPCP